LPRTVAMSSSLTRKDMVAASAPINLTRNNELESFVHCPLTFLTLFDHHLAMNALPHFIFGGREFRIGGQIVRQGQS